MLLPCVLPQSNTSTGARASLSPFLASDLKYLLAKGILVTQIPAQKKPPKNEREVKAKHASAQKIKLTKPLFGEIGCPKVTQTIVYLAAWKKRENIQD